MNKNKESEALNAHLEENINPEIRSNLENIKWFIDPDLFESFEKRILSIVWEEPWSDWVINAELWKTTLWLEEIIKNHSNTRLTNLIWVIADWNNLDNFFSDAGNDENFRLTA